VEYVEQLTMLLFLNMADQLTEPPHSKPPIVPPNLGWKPLLKLDGAALEKQYSDSIEKLGLKPGMLGVIFKGARCDIHNPALFKQLIVNLLRFVLRNFESPLGTIETTRQPCRGPMDPAPATKPEPALAAKLERFPSGQRRGLLLVGLHPIPSARTGAHN
jgi:hypothetical protein